MWLYNAFYSRYKYPSKVPTLLRACFKKIYKCILAPKVVILVSYKRKLFITLTPRFLVCKLLCNVIRCCGLYKVFNGLAYYFTIVSSGRNFFTSKHLIINWFSLWGKSYKTSYSNNLQNFVIS